MNNQKPILVKLDSEIYNMLEAECTEYGLKRNRLINIACAKEVARREEERRQNLLRSMQFLPESQERTPKVYTFNVELTSEDGAFLDFFRRQAGKDVSAAISDALKLLRIDYERRPFSYL